MANRSAGVVKACFILAAGIVSVLSCLKATGADFYPQKPFDPEYGYTAYVIPQTDNPPLIDGVMAPGEWDDAVLLGNMTNCLKKPRFGLLFARWAKWYLKWDADTFYLCCASQRLPNEALRCNLRDSTVQGDVVRDESVEFHLTPGGRNVIGASLPWSGQAIINSMGVGYYSKFAWEVAARSTCWNPGWKIGNKINNDSWVIEIAIPRNSLDLPQPNKPGDVWSTLLARNWQKVGGQQSAIASKITTFQEPQDHMFARLTDGAFARIGDLSNLLKGKVNVPLELGTCANQPEKLNISLIVENKKFEFDKEVTPPFKFEKNETVEVSKGKLVAWKAEAPDMLPKGGKYRLYLKVSSEKIKYPVLETNFFFEIGDDAWLEKTAKELIFEPYSFSAQLAPTMSKLLCSGDFLNSPVADKVMSLKVSVTRDGEKEPVFKGTSVNSHYKMITDTFQLPILTPGKYLWKMELVDKDGAALASKDGEIVKKDEAKEFPWWNFSGANIEKVLWPYEALRHENGGERVDYWGGSYFLNGLCLPRQLQVTANQEWWPEQLKDRPSVLLRSSQIDAVQDGKSAKVIMQGFPRTTQVRDWELRLRGFGQIGETVEIQSDSNVGQDGLLWVTVTLRPSMDSSSGKDVRRKEAVLDRMSIDIPFREDVAKMIVAHGSPGYASYTIGNLPEGKGVVWDSTKAGASAFCYGDMLPVVWLGNDQRGMTFVAENNKGWLHKDLPDQQVLRADGETVLRLNIVQDKLTIKGDHTFSFGFLPTPMRKMVPGWRMTNCSFSQSFMSPFATGRTPEQTGYNSTYIPASYQKSRRVMFNNTMKMNTELGGFEYAPHSEQGGLGGIFNHSNDWAAIKYFEPEWANNTWIPSFQNHMLWNMQKWINDGGLTGIYHDQFYPYPMPNAIAGAAYRLPDGRFNMGYNMLLDRTYAMREYALFLENGIAPKIICHTTHGGQQIAYPWVTAILDGEDHRIVANADYDFADMFPAERLQAYGNPWNWGNTFLWMILVDKGEEKWNVKQKRTFIGWHTLHDTTYQQPVALDAFFDWGMNDNRVKFWPYWRNRKILTVSNPDVLVSMWTLPDRVLLCAFNVGKKSPAVATIRVPLADLGLMPKVRAEYIRATDLETGKNANFDAWNGAVDVNIPPRDFSLISVRKYAN